MARRTVAKKAKPAAKAPAKKAAKKKPVPRERLSKSIEIALADGENLDDVLQRIGDEPLQHLLGKPRLYEPRFARVAKRVMALGGTVYDVADALGVHLTNVMRWKHMHDEFCEAMKVGGENSNDAVEASLFRRATGYHRKIEKIGIDAKSGNIARTITLEEVEPDPRAAYFWLTNRARDRWRRNPDNMIDDGEDVQPVQVNVTVKSARVRKDGDDS
jgi:hypothetical protein